MSLSLAAALRAPGRRGASEEGLERFPRGSKNGCTTGPSIGLTRPARPRTCPRPAPHLPASPAPAVHAHRASPAPCALRPHLRIGVPPPVSALQEGNARREERTGLALPPDPGGRVLGAPAGSWTRPGVGAVKGEAETPQLTSHNCGRHLPQGKP